MVALDGNGSEFVVRTPEVEIRTTAAVLACGLQNVPKMPAQGNHLARRLLQLHTADYRSAAQLPDGAVLVVGSGQSGCQIAEDLALAGRRVSRATSRVGRFPFTYRGRDLLGWLVDFGYWDQRPADLDSPSDIYRAVSAGDRCTAGGP